MPLRRLHDSAVKNLTPEQLTIARFWANLSGPGHSLAIASQIPVQESANLSPLLQQQRWSTFSVRTSHSSIMTGDADGFSRIYGGIHFQHGNLDGQAQGAALRAIVDALDWRR